MTCLKKKIYNRKLSNNISYWTSMDKGDIFLYHPSILSQIKEMH